MKICYYLFMWRIAIPIAALVLVTTALAYYRVFISPSKNTKSVENKQITKLGSESTEESEQTSSLGYKNRLDRLEEKVASLSASKNVVTGSQTLITQDQFKTVETTIRDLQTRVSHLETGSPTTTQPSVSRSPTYIPLGSTGSTQTLDWTSIATLEADIDSADYNGYSNMYLEINIRSFQGNGKAFTRLFNKTDGTAVANSEVSTTSSDYTTLISSGFRVSSGKKTYRIQLKTLTGYAADVQFARIRVVF